MLKFFKSCFSIFSLTALFTLASVAFSLDQREDSSAWLTEALKLQREIDFDAPLREATFIGTHNSYNSKAYQIPFVRYIDPNQKLSIYEQLNQGVRSLELDVHWTINKKLKKEILLCHAQDHHIGCSVSDRPISEALLEIKTWLQNNPQEIILLYIETFLDGHENELASQLEGYLGRYIYKPSDLPSKIKSNTFQQCWELPGNLTKADIFQADKRLIVVSKQCHERSSIYNSYVFAGIGKIPLNPFTLIDATITHFTSFPDCARTTVFKDDIYHQSMWRIYEDRTILSNTMHDEKKMQAVDIQSLNQCGINWPAMDMLSRNDNRLAASIWSWAIDYPKESSAAACTIYDLGQGIKNVECEKESPAFACRETSTHTFKAVQTKAIWRNGEKICSEYAGKNWHFAVPINSSQLHALKVDMIAKQLQTVWLNYIYNKKGKWQANSTPGKNNG